MSDERVRFDDGVRRLLDGAYPCCLTTLRADGAPYGVVIWCDREGDLVRVNARHDGRWLAHVRRDPRVEIVVVDTDDILRYVAVSGRVVGIEPDSDYAHIDGLSLLYEGVDRFRWSRPDEQARFKVTVEPLRVRLMEVAQPPAAAA
jgi:PPOX class probable F420-dependent enzyme